MATKKSVVGWPERLARAKKAAPNVLTYLGPNKSYPVRAGDCMSYRAAYTRALQQKEQEIANKALNRAIRLGCQWARKHLEGGTR